MVNYCCVENCGRSSKLSPHLNYYTLPKDKQRRLEWLKAAGRDDLIKNGSSRTTYRFCSRHFAVNCMKNRNLVPDATPTLCLPSCDTEKNDKAVPHHDIVCDSCKNTILGFRYKCVTCIDYDLCPKCEMLEVHSNHYMLRIPKPLKFKIADDLIKKWRSFFKAEHVNPDCNGADSSGCSSDDEPISKHVKKQYDSGLDLSEDVKDKIREEVTRVLSLKTDDKRKRKKEKKKSGDDSLLYKALSKSKKAKMDKEGESSVEPAAQAVQAPEVAFADVNAYKDLVDVKNEVLPAAGSGEGEETVFGQPLVNVRLSNDLTELMIEMTNNARKEEYKNYT